MPSHHLAQLNVGRLLEPFGSDLADDFIAALNPVNALLNSTPGFVWRLTGAGDSIDPCENLVTNLTVWESREALWHFTYKPEHLEFMRQRRRWFQPADEASTVLWWIPADNIPSVFEACERLNLLRSRGSTADAFTVTDPYDPTGEPALVEFR